MSPSSQQPNVSRIVLTFKDDELVIHTLYRTQELGPNPSTKARARVVQDLTRRGLSCALQALANGSPEASLVGTSGFTQREDVLLAATSPNAQQLVRGA
jgi:hypothetical protein